jgi:hypothetical protein
MMPQLPMMLITHVAMKAPRRPSLSAMTPPPTAPNIAPMFNMELKRVKEFTSPLNSGGRHKSRGFSEARGPVRPTGRPNDSEPHAKIAVNIKLRARVSVDIGTSSLLGPSIDERGDVFGDMLYSSDCAIKMARVCHRKWVAAVVCFQIVSILAMWPLRVVAATSCWRNWTCTARSCEGAVP